MAMQKFITTPSCVIVTYHRVRIWSFTRLDGGQLKAQGLVDMFLDENTARSGAQPVTTSEFMFVLKEGEEPTLAGIYKRMSAPPDMVMVGKGAKARKTKQVDPTTVTMFNKSTEI